MPGLDEDFGSDAAAFLASLVGNGKRFTATVVKRERGLGAREKHPRKAADKLHVVLKADGDEKLDVAREMLLEGLARLPRLHKVGVYTKKCSQPVWDKHVCAAECSCHI